MNTTRIAALARRVARRHTAGLIKPPPAMVEAVYKWVVACLALSEMERGDKMLREHYARIESGGYDDQTAIRELERLIAQVRKTPTKWKVYSEYATAVLMFGYGSWGRLVYKAFTKLTPEGEIELRERVEKDLSAAEARIESAREQKLQDAARQVAERVKLQHLVSEGSAYSPGPAPQTRAFPLDFTGWQYDAAKFQDLLEKQQTAHVQRIEDIIGRVRVKSPDDVPSFEELLASAKKNPRWRTIKVVLSDNIGKGAGSWNEITHTVSILDTHTSLLTDVRDTLAKVHDTVYHELQHMTQSLMAYALWSENPALYDRAQAKPTQPGFPRPDARTPQYVQHGEPTRGVGKDDLHSLDDVEFHTDLQGEITGYRRMLVRNHGMTSEQKRATFDHFTSRKLAPREYRKWNPPVDPSKFFAVLKKHAPRKYIEAVRELAAAVL